MGPGAWTLRDAPALRAPVAAHRGCGPRPGCSERGRALTVPGLGDVGFHQQRHCPRRQPGSAEGGSRRARGVRQLALGGREGTPRLGRARARVNRASISVLMEFTGAGLLVQSFRLLADSWGLADPRRSQCGGAGARPSLRGRSSTTTSLTNLFSGDVVLKIGVRVPSACLGTDTHICTSTQ